MCPRCRRPVCWRTNTPDVLTETTADFGFALLMATARRMAESERFLRDGLWNRWALDMFAGAEVHGSTLGILGMGRIGQAIARRAALGFGMPVIYHNRSRLDPQTESELGARYVSKDELLAQADHLMLVLPYSAESHHAIGAPELARMKPSATLINIARGGIVDDAALASALRERRIAAAGLDVFEGEPRVHPDLLTVPNVVLTPHIASATLENAPRHGRSGRRQPDRLLHPGRSADAGERGRSWLGPDRSRVGPSRPGMRRPAHGWSRASHVGSTRETGVVRCIQALSIADARGWPRPCSSCSTTALDGPWAASISAVRPALSGVSTGQPCAQRARDRCGIGGFGGARAGRCLKRVACDGEAEPSFSARPRLRTGCCFCVWAAEGGRCTGSWRVLPPASEFGARLAGA